MPAITFKLDPAAFAKMLEEQKKLLSEQFKPAFLAQLQGFFEAYPEVVSFNFMIENDVHDDEGYSDDVTMGGYELRADLLPEGYEQDTDRFDEGVLEAVTDAERRYAEGEFDSWERSRGSIYLARRQEEARQAIADYDAMIEKIGAERAGRIWTALENLRDAIERMDSDFATLMFGRDSRVIVTATGLTIEDHEHH